MNTPSYLILSVPEQDRKGVLKEVLTVVIDTSVTPAVVISTYQGVSYPYLGQNGGLPDQFVDEFGNLRNKYGQVALRNGKNLGPPVERETTTSPYIRALIDTYTQKFKAEQELKRDIESILNPNT